MQIVFLIIGLVVGALIGWLLAKFKQTPNSSNDKIVDLTRELATQTAINNGLEEKLKSQKEELSALQKTFTNEFENLANKIFEDKSKKFTDQNKTNLENILNPLKENIKDFEEKVDKTYRAEAVERNTLKGVIEQLAKLNQQMDQDTKNLTKALKGDSKKQGDWGEKRLELILEKAGLQKDVHYLIQKGFRNDENELLKPDFVIILPENKNLIVDSKVSLTAYTDYVNTEDEEKKKIFLRSHLESVRNHIKELSQKEYHKLYQINSPDYVLMYIPIEYAFFLSVQSDQELFSFGLSKNIILVTTSTLLATLSTVSFIWQQENQKRNVLEIAYEGGKLYDKFVAFIDDLKNAGNSLNNAKEAYAEAMNKLVLSPKKGDTIVGRIENLKQLGANATKSIPTALLERANEE